MSRSTRQKRGDARGGSAAIASAPSRASTTSYPSSRSAVAKTARIFGSSSTSRMVWPAPGCGGLGRILAVRGSERQPNRESGPRALLTGRLDCTAVLFHDVAHAGQAQAGAADLAPDVPGAVEPLEDPREVRRRDANPTVLDREHCPVA